MTEPAEEPNNDAPAAPGSGPPALVLAPSRPLTPEEERSLAHRSAMMEKMGWVLRFFARIFFAPVSFPARLSSTVAECSREGVPVYVMNAASLLDYLYFNFAFARLALPLARFANGVSLRLYRPWSLALMGWIRSLGRRLTGHFRPLDDGEILRRNVAAHRSALIFLRQGSPFATFGRHLGAVQPRSQHLRDLLEVQRKMDVPVFLIPQLLIWKRDPEKARRSFIDDFFGDSEAPGAIRKVLSFMRNFRRAFVQMGEPINLRTFVEEHASVEDDGLLAERLRFLIHQRFNLEQKIIRGPMLKDARTVRDEILQQADVQADLEDIARTTGKPLATLQKDARADLDKIAANFNMTTVEIMCTFLSLVWNRIYDGIEIDEDGLERVREVAKKSPIVLVPCHKSHIDYLILSYVFYNNGLIPPHIAAGDNLSFWPLGPIFRGGGAFFLRRSFKGDPVYAHIFRHYMRKLVREGYWLEFFIEGGRSRTGKLLPPRYGLLTHVMEAVADSLSPDVTFVPANIGYERIVEEGSYTRELMGGEKHAEGVGGLLKTTKVLASKYGRLRIQFGEPLSAHAFLAARGLVAPASEREPKAMHDATKRFGYEIVSRINSASVITTTSLVAMALLAHPKRGIGRDALLLRVGYLISLASRRGAVLSRALSTVLRARRSQLQQAAALDEAEIRSRSGDVATRVYGERSRATGEAAQGVVDEALGVFAAAKHVTSHRYEQEIVYNVEPAGRLNLDYYKNNILHPFVPDALLATTLLALDKRGELTLPRLREETKFLSRLFKFEFIYATDQPFERQFEATLHAFAEEGWIALGADGDADHVSVGRSSESLLAFFATMVRNFLESYYVMADSIEALRGGPLTPKDFITKVQSRADRAFHEGEVEHPEAVSRVNLSNALEIFVEQGHVVEQKESTGKKRGKLLALSERAQAEPSVVRDLAARIRALRT